MRGGKAGDNSGWVFDHTIAAHGSVADGGAELIQTGGRPAFSPLARQIPATGAVLPAGLIQ